MNEYDDLPDDDTRTTAQRDHDEVAEAVHAALSGSAGASVPLGDPLAESASRAVAVGSHQVGLSTAEDDPIAGAVRRVVAAADARAEQVAECLRESARETGGDHRA